jgi:hypothetical protein
MVVRKDLEADLLEFKKHFMVNAIECFLTRVLGQSRANLIKQEPTLTFSV